MKKMKIALCLTAAMLLMSAIPAFAAEQTAAARTGGNPFVDVQEGKWYYDAVMWGKENGVVAGLTANTFGPKESCTRGQIVTFLWRAMGCPEAVNKMHTFTDVDADAYYYKAMLWAVEDGITSGYTNTEFAPNETCTRAQMATFVWRLAGEVEVNTEHCLFTDVAEGSWYYDAAVWAEQYQVISGYEGGLFAPKDTVTRDQTITILWRAMDGSVVRIEYDHGYVDDYGTYTEYASVEAYDMFGTLVWNYEAEQDEVGQLDMIDEIGIMNGKYYLVDVNSVVALNLKNGSIAWINNDYSGTGDGAFGTDGTLYMCGYFGPDFLAIDKNGNTLKLIECYSYDYFWAYDVEFCGDHVKVMMEGTPSEEPAVLRINLHDWSVNIL